jgi:hypothetical protein
VRGEQQDQEQEGLVAVQVSLVQEDQALGGRAQVQARGNPALEAQEQEVPARVQDNLAQMVRELAQDQVRGQAQAEAQGGWPVQEGPSAGPVEGERRQLVLQDCKQVSLWRLQLWRARE